MFLNIRGGKETVDSIHAMLGPLQDLFPDKNLNPKNIRKSVISNWLNVHKYPIEEVQRLAGHRWTSTTAKYQRNDDEAAREMINRFHPLM